MYKRILFAVALCFASIVAFADVKLPRIISDNMVLQRHQPVNIWGWASSGETVRVTFNGQQVETKASKKGTWKVSLKPMEHGGPFDMTIKGKNTIVLHNILIGDVWLGSGQSNMEWPLQFTRDADEEIAASDFPNIRLFTVEKDMSFKVRDDLKTGEWLVCNPKNSRFFSAVAYYFGKKLHLDLDVPIGLVNSSWGGTRVEPWISWDLIGSEPEFKNLNLAALEKDAEKNEKNFARFAEALKLDPGIKQRWFDPAAGITGWKKINLPKEWSQTEIGDTDGIVWFRKSVTLGADAAGEATLSLGPIDDVDYTYVNGVQVGSMDAYNKDRSYKIKAGLLKAGENHIVVKVVDNQGGGGLYGKPEQLYLETSGKRVSLAGEWEWKSSVITSDFKIINYGPNSYPSHLYNAMIAPMISFPIKGVIWYQGESNAGESHHYQTLFPMLIRNWREKWGYELPFFWAQLANFMKPADEPGESGWAELREAQRLTLSVPKTGQAVLLDIGEANDIHPRNKKDVGERLALNALAIAYGKDVVYSGPLYKSMKVSNGRAILSFDHVGSGLIAKGNRYGYLNGFSVAGKDGKFYWAKAFVQGNEVVVFHESVPEPVAVRYAWADNPDDANLYNKEGLPASSFKTDDWKWSTQR